MRTTVKSAGLYIMALFYLLAGINHFISPGSYIKLIPPYLPLPEVLNIVAGIAEILLGVLLFFPAVRVKAAWGIIFLLIAFLPAHVYMIQQAPIQMGSFVITPFIAWLRLPVQLLLVVWAYQYCRKG